MPTRTSSTGSELFIVDNSDVDWEVARYLHDWCELSKSIDIATGIDVRIFAKICEAARKAHRSEESLIQEWLRERVG